uniref:Ig-like domain-containing protein n=1 Tax=Oreochromis niloticus TaxID=8128 RepID=A0A669DV75_ORENI
MMVFFVNLFLLCSSCAAQLSEVSQPESLKTVKIGHSATIKCFIKSASVKRMWYKVTTGRKLQLVVKTNSQYNVREFSDEFVNRSSVKFDMTNNHLTINKTSWEDIGTYFCGVLRLSDVQFGSGTFLMLTGAKTISDSVVQLCSLHSAQCTAELTSFMWLKNSDHSAPEMIYCSDNKNNISQRTDRGRTTCVYNFVISSRDDAGVYYCAVNACGQILFGNGTRINNADTESIPLGPTVIALMLSNMVHGAVVPLHFTVQYLLCNTFVNSQRCNRLQYLKCAIHLYFYFYFLFLFILFIPFVYFIYICLCIYMCIYIIFCSRPVTSVGAVLLETEFPRGTHPRD